MLMRITKISVKGLFGMFDHDIPLNQESRITIIHGPNGVGKTVLLTTVNSLFHYDYEYICGISFRSLSVDFEDGSQIVIDTNLKSEDADDRSSLSVNFVDKSGEHEAPFTASLESQAALTEKIKELHPGLVAVNFIWNKTYWLALGTTEEKEIFADVSSAEDLVELLNRGKENLNVFSNEDLLLRDPSLHSAVYGTKPDWYARVQESVHVEKISTSRLMREFDISEVIWSWLFYASHLLGADKDVDLKLKRMTFPGPREAVTGIAHDYRISLNYFYTYEQLRKNEIEIIELRSALNSEAVIVSEIATDALNDQLSNLYDDRKELQDDPGYRRAHLFIELLNERFLFKYLEFDEDENTQVKSENGNIVPFSSLSSGEQHLFILYHYLLFKVEPDTLVMIDEPELSMNVVWQRNFLKDLQRIIELRKFDVLIATHSPQIIHDKWDWVVHLGERVDD